MMEQGGLGRQTTTDFHDSWYQLPGAVAWQAESISLVDTDEQALMKKTRCRHRESKILMKNQIVPFPQSNVISQPQSLFLEKQSQQTPVQNNLAPLLTFPPNTPINLTGIRPSITIIRPHRILQAAKPAAILVPTRHVRDLGPLTKGFRDTHIPPLGSRGVGAVANPR